MTSGLENSFGSYIDHLRGKKNWSIEQMAMSMEVDSHTARRVLSGAGMPSVKTLLALSVSFDVDVSHLIVRLLHSPATNPFYVHEEANRLYQRKEYTKLKDFLYLLDQMKEETESVSVALLYEKIIRFSKECF